MPVEVRVLSTAYRQEALAKAGAFFVAYEQPDSLKGVRLFFILWE